MMMKEKVMMLNFRLTLTRTSKKKTQIISTKMTWVSAEYILTQLRCYGHTSNLSFFYTGKIFGV